MKRLNVKLALWLVGIAVFSAVSVHFLHGFQVDRNADSLKIQAEQARSAGNDDEAITYYSQYLRHRDDREAYQALAELTVEAAKDPKATRNDFIKAFNVLEEAIRRYPDLDSVRMSLIDYTIGMRRTSDAQDHIRILKEKGSTDTGLPLREAQCFLLDGENASARKKLFEIVGYNEETKQFAEEPPATAQEIDAFAMLSRLLHAKDGDPALADAVMEKVVEWNPDSAKAHLARATYLLAVWQKLRADTPEGKDLQDRLFAETQEELKKASELDPKNAEAKLLTASTRLIAKDFDGAKALLDEALEQFPERSEVYLQRAQLAMVQKKPEEAAAELKAGLKVVANQRPLLEQLVEVQFQLRDLDAVEKTCEQMTKLGTIPPEFIGYQQARLKVGRGNFLEAMRELERVRPAMDRLSPGHMNSVNTLLGRCYAVLGMSDRQLEAYRRILANYPTLIEARIGETAALQALGRHDEAEASIEMLANVAPQAAALQPEILRLVVNQEMSKPVEERNWERSAQLSKLLENSGQRTALQSRLLEVDLLLAQGKSDEALSILGALRKEHPKEVMVWLQLCKLMASEEKYRDRLPQLLTLAEKEVGESAPLLAERIKLVTRTGGENASQELQKLEEKSKQFEAAQQQGLLAQLGIAYLQVGDYENGKRCLKSVMAKEPSNVRIRQVLFDLALERRDDAMVNEIIAELKKSPSFGPQSAFYRYAEAAREVQQLVAKREGKTTPLTEEEQSKLAEARKLVDEALAMRSEWAPLYRLRADINQLSGDLNGAISDLQRSLTYSQTGQEISARKLVTLLYATERFAEANEAMKYLNPNAELPEGMRRIGEAVVMKGGDPKKALAMVREDIQKDPENPSHYMWLGELLEASDDGEGAEVAFRKATEKGPKLARAWEFYVRRLMANNKAAEAAAATEQAGKSLGDDPLAMARLYQRIGSNEQAEKMYEAALAQKPNDLLILRHMAEFYLLTKNIAKAQEQLDKIIAAGGKSDEPGANAHVAWARTQKAQNLATERDYAGTMEAVKLIEANAVDGELSKLDTVALLSLLAPRLEEPSSREKAIKLFDKLSKFGPLDPQQTVTLAQLYNRDGDWQRARELMVSASTAFENSAEVAAIFAEMLYEQEAYDEAKQYTDRLQSLLQDTLTPATSAVARGARILQARLLVRDGKKEEAAKVLEGWLPRPLPQNQLPLLLDVANQMESLELYAEAERLLEDYRSQSPKDGVAILAGFKGRRGDIEQSFAMLDQARANLPVVNILPIALANLRNFPEQVTAAQKQQLEEWSKAALAESKNPDGLRLLMAEYYDLQGRYGEVEKIYRELLANPKLSRLNRAIVQNNLAFILAGVNPTPQRGAEAQKLIEESIAVLGPTSDLLDTRALAYLAQGKMDQAAADIQAAVGDRPSTSKYYHLAQVEKQRGNVDAAREAIAKAQELHGEHNPFTPFERKGYEQLKSEMN